MRPARSVIAVDAFLVRTRGSRSGPIHRQRPLNLFRDGFPAAPCRGRTRDGQFARALATVCGDRRLVEIRRSERCRLFVRRTVSRSASSLIVAKSGDRPDPRVRGEGIVSDQQRDGDRRLATNVRHGISASVNEEQPAMVPISSLVHHLCDGNQIGSCARRATLGWRRTRRCAQSAWKLVVGQVERADVRHTLHECFWPAANQFGASSSTIEDGRRGESDAKRDPPSVEDCGAIGLAVDTPGRPRSQVARLDEAFPPPRTQSAARGHLRGALKWRLRQAGAIRVGAARCAAWCARSDSPGGSPCQCRSRRRRSQVAAAQIVATPASRSQAAGDSDPTTGSPRSTVLGDRPGRPPLHDSSLPGQPALSRRASSRITGGGPEIG